VKRRQPEPTDCSTIYRGRFAPSPTGPLHFGSLVTATASYLQAIANSGEWLLRIENIDPPREPPGASEQIVTTLTAHGFEWSGPIHYQSESRFDDALNALVGQGRAFRCTCSRRRIQADARTTGAMGPIYPGTCRNAGLTHEDAETHAIRVRVDETSIAFDDFLHGHINSALGTDIGDFIVRRADGLFAYVLAVVTDDHAQGITEVVRGDDLLGFTPAQIYLQQLLGLNTPKYFHLPVAVDAAGVKLSKQTGAMPVDDSKPAGNLVRCLDFLGQDPPVSLALEPLPEIWNWARANWRPRRLAATVENRNY
jgi:glutamyl-Q tRNA(Asp) synthetase